MLGDFNLPELGWKGDETNPVNNGSLTVFCDLLGDNYLCQFVPGPTHIAGKKLDLVLCNWLKIIENVLTFNARESIFPSDHYVVEFQIRLKF